MRQSSCSGSSSRSWRASARIPGSWRSRDLRSGSGRSGSSSWSWSSVADRRSRCSSGSSSGARWSGATGSSSGSSGSRARDRDGSVRGGRTGSWGSNGSKGVSRTVSARSLRVSLYRLSSQACCSPESESRCALRLSSRRRPVFPGARLSRRSRRASSLSRSSRSSSAALHCFWLIARGGASTAGLEGGMTAGSACLAVRCSSNCRAALNTCRHEPQRTTPRATLN
ncbi:hypothetical protein D3C76_1169580 [compost metagenome]